MFQRVARESKRDGETDLVRTPVFTAYIVSLLMIDSALDGIQMNTYENVNL